MKNILLILIAILFFHTNCCAQFNELINEKPTVKEIICDSFYRNKGYKITLAKFNTTNEDETIPNTVFIFSKQNNDEYKIIYTDSIFSAFQSVRFIDFDGDKVKDILVQNTSDVRSNYTYYLYLIDTVNNKLTKIKGFEQIKNPSYLPRYNLIDNMVVSGTNYTSFYAIKSGTVKDYHITIYDNQTNDGSYNREYDKALKRILQQRKKRMITKPKN